MIANPGYRGIKVIASGRLVGTPLGKVTFPESAAFVLLTSVEPAMSSYYASEFILLTPGMQCLNISGNPSLNSTGNVLSLTAGATGTTQYLDYIAIA